MVRIWIKTPLESHVMAVGVVPTSERGTDLHILSSQATRSIIRVTGHRWIGSSMHTQAKGSIVDQKHRISGQKTANESLSNEVWRRYLAQSVWVLIN